MTINFSNPQFLLSATDIRQTPTDAPYIVFAGRSNAGKSSVLNALCGGRYARVSRTPGRTRAINVFRLGEAFLADLPGYGYAAGSKAEQKLWGPRLATFIRRAPICGLAAVVDCRRGIGVLDEQLFALCRPVNIPALVILNKMDKLNRQQQKDALALARQKMPTVIPFSATKKTGVAEVQAAVGAFLNR